MPVSIGDRAHIALAWRAHGTELLRVRTVWKGERRLIEVVRQFYPNAIREYAPEWLRGQRLDVFIPSEGVAIELQGEQHYKPVKYFGGRPGLKATKERDRRKARACEEAGEPSLSGKYDEHLDEYVLEKKFREIGLRLPVRPSSKPVRQ